MANQRLDGAHAEAFLAANYAAAVAAGYTAQNPERAAQMIEELTSDPEKAKAYFHRLNQTK